MGSRGLLVAVLAGLCSACLQPDVTTCDDGQLCPAGTACVPGGCASEAQVGACEDVAPGGACELAGVGAGACVDGWCQVAVCGNRRVDAGEACDDGNQAPGDGCNATCSSIEMCGNGFVDLGEACDCGTDQLADGCLALNGADDGLCRDDCSLRRCGDGVIDPVLGEACDAGADNSDAPDAPCRLTCQATRCGDEVTDILAGEVCDDGNLLPGDGCTPDCASDESCGNGTLDFFAGEACDDGGARRGDGCAPECTLERPTWSEREGTPVARAAAAAAYDVARARVVLFGGTSGAGPLDDTWEWDGAAWWRIPTARSPVARAGAAMGYDAAVARVVLFGGVGAAGRRGDTWSWDGVGWREHTAAGPLARDAAAMASVVGGGLVLFGGRDEAGVRADTWRWADGAWTELAPDTSPAARAGHAMALDPSDGRVLLFGGWDGAARLSDTWSWDGTDWAARAPLASPSARAGHALVVDARRGGLVLVGGNTGAPSASAWRWDGATWTSVSAPSAREQAAGAYDAARDAVVLFGGTNGTALGDTQLWNGGGWSTRALASSPLQQYVPTLAIEPARGAVLLFGGLQRLAGTTNNETWRWDGGAWSKLTLGVAPSARADASMTYDAVRGEIVLFGGRGSFASPTSYADTWVWNGAAWSARTPASSPPSRWGHGAVWDSARARVVIYGGDSEFGRRGDTWAWDGTTWTAVVAPAPAPRAYLGMAYDPLRDRVVVFGGGGEGAVAARLQETWEFDGDVWTLRDPATSPQGRVCLGTLTFDSRRGRVVLVGGLSDAGPLNDTWEWDGEDWTFVSTIGAPDLDGYYGMVDAVARRELLLVGGDRGAGRIATWSLTYRGDTGPEACDGGGDYDLDGRVGCQDDDCAGRCTPSCAPGPAEAGVCDPADPELARCGDGVCALVEGCTLCPDDCGACADDCGDLRCTGGEDAASCPVDCAA